MTEDRIDKQAEKVSITYSALRFLEQLVKGQELLINCYALNSVKEQQPKVEEQPLNIETRQNKRKNSPILDKDFEKER